MRGRWLYRLAVIAVLGITLFSGSIPLTTFLQWFNAPTGDWFVDGAGIPIAGACEAAALQMLSVSRIEPSHQQIAPEDARKIAERAIMTQFGLSAPPDQLAIPVLGYFDDGSPAWIIVAALPHTAAAARLSEAEARTAAVIVRIDVRTGNVVELFVVADAASPESCQRDVREIARTLIRLRTSWIAAGGVGLLVLLVGGRALWGYVRRARQKITEGEAHIR
jgi:hypothetical protein